nr:hypothetical protein [Ktedonobacter robiniae]
MSRTPLRDFGVGTIGPIEGGAQILIVLRAVPCDARTELVEELDGQTTRISGQPWLKTTG